MKGTLSLSFDDGSVKEIELKNVVVINTSSEARQELSFRQTNNGWIMAITQGLLDDKKLATNFCKAVKNTP